MAIVKANYVKRDKNKNSGQKQPLGIWSTGQAKKGEKPRGPSLAVMALWDGRRHTVWLMTQRRGVSFSGLC
jgi:hypothetical protein